MNIRKSINNVLRRYGYSLEHDDEVGGLSFGLYQYRDNAGGFDYEHYREIQTAGNVRKIFLRRKDPLDPFGAPLEMMPYLICDWAEGQFGVRRILQTPTKGRYNRNHGIVIQRFEKPDVSARPRVPDTASCAT